ncbi:MAG: hypothetical protein FD180_2509 [Planctomycetota bacterium]|nr:MAG: hypothetical protein FD180_2509 [Planctomycetota bacterium]
MFAMFTCEKEPTVVRTAARSPAAPLPAAHARQHQWVAVVLGTLIAGYGAWVWRREAAVEGWPSVSGVMESCEFKPPSLGIGKGRCQVRYRYTVQGVAYQGNRLTWSGTSPEGTTYSPEVFQKSYPTGTPCSVRYNPDRPSNSCLLQSMFFAWSGPLILGFALLGLSAWSFLRSRTASRRA